MFTYRDHAYVYIWYYMSKCQILNKTLTRPVVVTQSFMAHPHKRSPSALFLTFRYSNTKFSKVNEMTCYKSPGNWHLKYRTLNATGHLKQVFWSFHYDRFTIEALLESEFTDQLKNELSFKTFLTKKSVFQYVPYNIWQSAFSPPPDPQSNEEAPQWWYGLWSKFL
jgi:hypothetical protein